MQVLCRVPCFTVHRLSNMCVGGEESVYEFVSHAEGSSHDFELAVVEGAHAREGFIAACPRFHLQLPDYIF